MEAFKANLAEQQDFNETIHDVKLELEELQSKLQGVENEKKHLEAKYDQVSRLNKVFKRHVNRLS